MIDPCDCQLLSIEQDAERDLDALLAQDVIVTRNEAARPTPALYTQYVIRSTASNWYLVGARTWSASVCFAQRFDSMTEATLAAMQLVPEESCRVEPVAPVEGV